MPHVLFAAPRISSFPLHDRLAELAMRRGHRVTVLAFAPHERAFWAAQGLPAPPLPGGPDDPGWPLRELAEVDCRLAGHAPLGSGHRTGAERTLRRHAAGISALLASEAPDAVVVHDGRSGAHRLVHFCARRLGIGIVHVGEGLLPGTLAVDALGVDGDSSLCSRTAADYRAVTADPAFLRAALAAWLGDSARPCALLRQAVAPPLVDRCWSAAAVAWRSGVAQGLAAFSAWRAAAPGAHTAVAPLPRLETPLIAVLLQPSTCPRVRLDAPPAVRARTVLTATRAAAAALDPGVTVVGVLPNEPMDQEADLLATAGCQILPHAAARATLAVALAVVTINHPLAGAALLHGTPVVHLGRAIYGVPGVTVSTTLTHLRHALATALANERPTLRERFLTRVLRRDHVWCAAGSPDRNGVHGLMQVIERAIAKGAGGAGPLVYRPGPAWPLQPAPAQ